MTFLIRVIILLLCVWPMLSWANTRLGLHVTSDELACWKQRAGVVTPGSLTPSCGTSASGGVGAAARYRTSGDVQTNSPGDWTHILSNAGQSLSGDRWSGVTTGTCVPRGDTISGIHPIRGDFVRDAAFAYLVTGTVSYRTAALAELLAQVGVSGVNFGDGSTWCLSLSNDSDNFFRPAIWVAKLLWAYDYILAGDQVYGQTLSAPNKATLDTWFANAATFFEATVHGNLSGNFVDRKAGNYTLTGQGNTECTTFIGIPYFGGPSVFRLMDWYNNRRAVEAMVYMLVGIQQNNSTWITEGSRFFQEFFRFSIFSDGTPSEFDRWGTGLPALGWVYAMTTLGELTQFAEALARTGDPSLFTYTTSAGACGTSGGSKGLQLYHTEMAKYVDHTYVRYGTDVSGNNGNANYAIDTNDGVSGEAYVHDVMLSQGNLYYQLPYLDTIYRRTAPGQNGYTVPGYPVSPATGTYYAWGSSWGMLPGVTLMWGQLAGVVNPYTLASDSTIPNAPANLRVVSP